MPIGRRPSELVQLRLVAARSVSSTRPQAVAATVRRVVTWVER